MVLPFVKFNIRFAVCPLELVQCLLYVVKNIVSILYTHRKADEVGRYSSLSELFVGELAVCVACWMEHTRAAVGHMSDNADKFQRVHEVDSRLAVAFQSEGHHAARAVGQVFLSQRMVLVVRQSAVFNPCHAVISGEKLCHALCVGAVLTDA